MVFNKAEAADKAYKTLCTMLDNKGWRYKKDNEGRVINCSARGEDLPMDIIIRVDEERSLISLLSRMPFDIKEEKKIDAAIAVTMVNSYLADGHFIYDLASGGIVFKMTSSFLGSELGELLFEYMLLVSCHTIDEYNDKFLMLSLGNLDIDAFAE